MAGKDWPQGDQVPGEARGALSLRPLRAAGAARGRLRHWKDDERAAALAAADRFIKLYPNHANVDYAYYLKGLINFNDALRHVLAR